MSKDRVEALSDGVIAIAITLLILEIDVPEGAGENLPHQLAEQWLSYLSYVVSFFVIGVIWLNHHALFSHLARVDRKLMAGHRVRDPVALRRPRSPAARQRSERRGDTPPH